jgi:diaminopimelate epimerase
MIGRGTHFWKMTGSGNDFVFFDARAVAPGPLESAPVIAAICDRRRGVGADGVVFVERHEALPFAIRYLNRDGSLAELCGNASLCSVALGRRLGIVGGDREFQFGTSSGPLTGRFVNGGPEIETPAGKDVQPAFPTPRESGESRIGFAKVGVPHLVVFCDDVETVDVIGRGRSLRYLRSLPAGANVNFVSPEKKVTGRWAMRTYERGVEDETLACGTGAVATAVLLGVWQVASTPVTILTRSGVDLVVSFIRDPAGGAIPSLRGEGRLVFEGTLEDIQSY